MGGTFSGEHVLIAGGTGALGRAVVRAFLDEGASILVTYRKQEELERLRQEAGADAGRIDSRLLDVTNQAAVAEMISDTIAKHARLDAMVNTVGGYAAGSTLWEMDPGVLDQMLRLNLCSGYVLSRAIVPVMLKQGHGAIVNVAARAAIDHAAAAAAYAASKAAAVAMIDSLAADLKGTGVRANSLLPSIIDTEANRKAMPKADFGKWPKPADIASVILFLCSDKARLINGASILV
jgi:NAD(P)-dependent dehydrogenase (short-subunit alcohol dehydrogenase family)